MRPIPLAMLALAAGAAAVYFLDPRSGARRRAGVGQHLARWREAAGDQVQGRGHELGQRLQGLAADTRGWIDRRLHRNGSALPDGNDGLEPLDMTPQPLQPETSMRQRVLPALALATPVAVAVGAALLRRRDDGHWIH